MSSPSKGALALFNLRARVERLERALREILRVTETFVGYEMGVHVIAREALESGEK